MKVLILNGAAESGKGTVVEYIKHCFLINALEYSSIDYVKKVAVDQFGWDGEKDAKGRILLSEIKQLMINYNDLPFKKVAEVISDCVSFNEDLLVVDVREPEEIRKVVKQCKIMEIDCAACKVERKEAESRAKKQKLHPKGDLAYDSYAYDYYINNDGTLYDLELVVGHVLKPFFRRSEI